jgi:putative flippase GtrA
VGTKIRRWGVFNAVASGGFIIQIAAITLLTRWWGWSPMAATALGVEMAALHNFFGHTRWTWSDVPAHGTRALFIRYLKYQLAKTASLGLNVAATLLLIRCAGLPVEMANVLAVLLCSVPNYFAIERLVFTPITWPAARRGSRLQAFLR